MDSPGSATHPQHTSNSLVRTALHGTHARQFSAAALVVATGDQDRCRPACIVSNKVTGRMDGKMDPLTIVFILSAILGTLITLIHRSVNNELGT